LRVIDSPDGNFTGSFKDCVMMELEVPSNSFSLIGGTEVRDRLCFRTNLESTKQWVDPESTRAEIGGESRRKREVRDTRSELGSERADALSRTSSLGAQDGVTQSSVCAEV